MTEPLVVDSPWSRRAGTVTVALLLVGIGSLIIGCWGVSGTTHRTQQYDWLNVGIVGVIVIGTANCGWLIAGRRRFAVRAAAIYQRIDGLTPIPELQHAVTPTTEPKLVVATGMRHYHRPECEYARGKKVSAATLARHERAGRGPCPVCRP